MSIVGYAPTRDMPVLVTRLNLGHRVGAEGQPSCGSGEDVALATALQAYAYQVMPCPQCWLGNPPW